MSTDSVEHRAAKVSLVSGLSTILSILFQLISVPVCLHFWGAQRYGEWLAIFAAATLLRTVDGGYIVYTGNRLNMLYHQDRSALRKVLAAGSLSIAFLGVLQLVVLAIVIGVGGLGWLLGDGQLVSDASAKVGLIVLVSCWVLTGSYMGLLHQLMVPAGLLYQAAWWSMAFQVLVFFAIIIAAILRLDLLGTSILVASMQVAIYLASAVYLQRKLPDFFPWWRGAEWRQAAADLRGSLAFTLSGVLQQATTNGLILIVSGVLGAAAVPAFTTVRTLVNLWNNVTNTLTAPLLPDMVRLHAQGQVEKLLMLARAHSWLLGSVVNLGIVGMYPVIAWAYGVWTHHQLVLDMRLLAAMLASMLLVNTGSFMATYLAGINDTQAVLFMALARASLCLSIAWVLLPITGLVGAGIGILVAQAVCFLMMALHYFPNAIRALGSQALRGYFPLWSSLAAAVVLLYVGSVALLGRVSLSLYLVSIALVLVFMWLEWRRLEPAVRIRLSALASRYYLRGGMK